MNYNIAVLRGDGIGPEVTGQAVKVLRKIGALYGHTFDLTDVSGGGVAIATTGEPLPEETIAICRNADAVLFGAVGDPKWDDQPPQKRPEQAVLGLRKALGLYANLRPAIVFDELKGASPLKPEIIAGGLDILIVRELTGGVYFGPRGTAGEQELQQADSLAGASAGAAEGVIDGSERSEDPSGGGSAQAKASDDERSLLGMLHEKSHRAGHRGEYAFDVEQYSESEVRRIAVTAFELARKRNGNLLSVDKANVLDTSRLWRKVVTETAKNYPDVKLSHMYVDNAAMQLVRSPRQFDVIVTGNLFGDILSDEASQITGSIGMLPSASLAEGSFGLYEPIHGSAPDIAGQDKANPVAAILSVAMLLRYSLSLSKEADAVEAAVKAFLSEGYRTPDIYTPEVEGVHCVGTQKAGDLILERLA